MTEEHTPGEMHFDGMDLWISTLDGLNHVAELAGSWNESKGETVASEVNGRRLALAWNCHEELLEALNSFLYEFGDKASSVTVAKARAAIAKATGGNHD